jgi:hemolysin activation/secretion protein
MAQNDMGLKLSQGLSLFGASDKNSDKLSRDDGVVDYTKIEANYSRIQPINDKWSLVASTEVQYTNQPLLAGEEFGFGGSRNGKAYDPSELSGDRGISLSMEAQYTEDLVEHQTTLQPYAFYEIGKVWNLDGGNTVGESAANIGIGTRAQIKNDWQLDVKMAQPLTRDVDNPAPYTSADGPRVTFTVRRAF